MPSDFMVASKRNAMQFEQDTYCVTWTPVEFLYMPIGFQWISFTSNEDVYRFHYIGLRNKPTAIMDFLENSVGTL